MSIDIHLQESGESKVYTLRRKSIGPFADFSYKMAIFKRLEKYLKVTQNSSLVHQLLVLMGDAFQ